jgi:hypothetical protein
MKSARISAHASANERQNGTAGTFALLLAECATGSRREVPTHELRFTLLLSHTSEISTSTSAR